MSYGLCFIFQGTDKNLLNCGVKQSKKFSWIHHLTQIDSHSVLNFPHVSARLTIFPECTSHHSPETCTAAAAADVPSTEAPVCRHTGGGWAPSSPITTPAVLILLLSLWRAMSSVLMLDMLFCFIRTHLVPGG